VAPKSNAGYMAYNKAKAFVKGDTTRPVPLHLRNAPPADEAAGLWAGLRYAHSEEERLCGGRALSA
jgi:putative ATPase